MNTNNVNCLLTLPAEMLCHIISYLDIDGIINLAIASKHCFNFINNEMRWENELGPSLMQKIKGQASLKIENIESPFFYALYWKKLLLEMPYLNDEKNKHVLRCLVLRKLITFRELEKIFSASEANDKILLIGTEVYQKAIDAQCNFFYSPVFLIGLKIKAFSIDDIHSLSPEINDIFFPKDLARQPYKLLDLLVNRYNIKSLLLEGLPRIRQLLDMDPTFVNVFRESR